MLLRLVPLIGRFTPLMLTKYGCYARKINLTGVSRLQGSIAAIGLH